MLGKVDSRLTALLFPLLLTLSFAPPTFAAPLASQTPQTSGGKITTAEPKPAAAARPAIKPTAKKPVAKKPVRKPKPVKKPHPKPKAKPKPKPKPAPVRRPPPATQAPAKPVAPTAPQPQKPELKTEAPKVLLTPEQADARYLEAVSLERAGDHVSAFKAYEEAAENGHALAQKKLGDLYGTGSEVVQRDYETSLRWYSKARDQGVQVPKPFVYPGVRR